MATQTVGKSPDASAEDSARRTDRLAITSALIGGLLIAGVVGTRCNVPGLQMGALSQGLSETGQPTRGQVGYQPHEVVSEVSVSARTDSQTASASQPTEPPAPTSQAVAPGESVRISGTDGRGVLLRTSPQDAYVTTRGLIEGWEVVVLEWSGDWARVRGPNGQEGWVPTRYLKQ